MKNDLLGAMKKAIVDELTPSKHHQTISKFNRLVIAYKLHIAGVELLDAKQKAELDKLASEIRTDLEGCKDSSFRTKYL
jgi:hypothetical protein